MNIVTRRSEVVDTITGLDKIAVLLHQIGATASNPQIGDSLCGPPRLPNQRTNTLRDFLGGRP